MFLPFGLLLIAFGAILLCFFRHQPNPSVKLVSEYRSSPNQQPDGYQAATEYTEPDSTSSHSGFFRSYRGKQNATYITYEGDGESSNYSFKIRRRRRFNYVFNPFLKSPNQLVVDNRHNDEVEIYE